MSESNPTADRFRQMMNTMQFDTLPLFSRPHFSWKLKTEYVGRRFIYRPETESTMEDARRMIERRGPFGGPGGGGGGQGAGPGPQGGGGGGDRKSVV